MRSMQDLIRAMANEELAAIERACEQALQGGKYGVLVQRLPWTEIAAAALRGTVKMWTWAGPCIDVPYGTIVYQDLQPGGEIGRVNQ